MLNKIFDIESFNIFNDEENYYFFRSLEEVDIQSINNKKIIDEKGNIKKLITDREFYGETIYKKDDPISLEQIIEHIKIGYYKHTNCISFSSNTNVILNYGRNEFNDRYVMLKVPKKEFGNKVINAGKYILEEINKKIDVYYNKHQNNPMIKYFFDAIDNAKTEEKLEEIKKMVTNDFVDESKNIFINGLDKIISSSNYDALNSSQNLMKDKIILKMDLMKENILDRIGNKFLINTLGCAFSSLEIIHYNDVDDNIKEISPEIIDVLSLLQQVEETKEIKEIKQLLIKKINNNEIKTKSFQLEKYNIENIKKSMTLYNIYNLTDGNISYGDAKNMYVKSYILAKSVLRKEKSLDLLKDILNDSKYDKIIDQMRKNTYGIESLITDRVSNFNSMGLSESVKLLVSKKEEGMLNYINSLDRNQLEKMLENPFIEFKKLNKFLNKINLNNNEWLANSIIDLIDWSYYGINDNLDLSQRKMLIDSFNKNNIIDIYKKLSDKNFDDFKIANAIILMLIKEKEEVDFDSRFTLDELEEFLGCNQIKNTKIKLKSYQREAFDNVNRIFNEKYELGFNKQRNFVAAIMPTGTGKSYLAISEMHYFENKMQSLNENKHSKILYLAPNNYILEQLKRIIAYNYRLSFVEKEEDIVKRVFPNLVLQTYSYLTAGKDARKIIESKYDFIVLDELHRTGADEWGNDLNKLLDNQDDNIKVLGITATPERDVDGKDMSEILAKKYGYTDEEILENKHLACNMNLLDAIEKGIIHNPNVINCEYSLLKEGSLDELKYNIENISNEELKDSKLIEYENLRKEVINSDGIEKILKENLKVDGKYIVFIPLTKNKEGKYINTESNKEVTNSQAQVMIRSYQNLMSQFIFSGEYLEKNKDILVKINEKIDNNINLSKEENMYLIKEKENIQLLTKLHINNMPNALQTMSNDISLKIINYMKWEVLQDGQIASRIREKVADKVENYNMISDNSKKENDKNLANFNSSNSNKKKFMFVMDMLNEGVHVEKIDGIIWFRVLNENSKILFLQQLGRCISAVCEENKDRIPTVIDLVNNTIKVDILKGVTKEKEDLSSLIEIVKNIENKVNYNIDLNNISKEEYSFLKRIQREYNQYLNIDLLEIQKLEKKVIIKEILELGKDIDLWNNEFVNEINNSSNVSERRKDLIGRFEITGILRKFSSLYNEVKDQDVITPERYVELIELYCKEYKEWPKQRSNNKIENKNDIKTGGQLVSWLYISGYNKDEWKYEESLKQKLDELKVQFYKEQTSIEDYVKLIELYCKEYKEWPKNGSNNKIENKNDIKTGNQLARWLNYSGYNKDEWKYEESLKQKLDELKLQFYKEKKAYDKIDKDFNLESHFQNAISILENSKEKKNGKGK